MKRVKLKDNKFLDSNYIVHGMKKLSKILGILDKLNCIDIPLDGKDLNTLVGEFIVGYGNDCINKPINAANGYFINIPHFYIRDLYNKQIFMPRDPNEIYVRNQENGVWSEWNKI